MDHYETATQTWERGYKVVQRKLSGSCSPHFFALCSSQSFPIFRVSRHLSHPPSHAPSDLAPRFPIGSEIRVRRGGPARSLHFFFPVQLPTAFPSSYELMQNRCCGLIEITDTRTRQIHSNSRCNQECERLSIHETNLRNSMRPGLLTTTTLAASDRTTQSSTSASPAPRPS